MKRFSVLNALLALSLCGSGAQAQDSDEDAGACLNSIEAPVTANKQDVTVTRVFNDRPEDIWVHQAHLKREIELCEPFIIINATIWGNKPLTVTTGMDYPFQIHRSIDVSPPTCNHPEVGGVFLARTSNRDEPKWSVTTRVVDTGPFVTGQIVHYTICTRESWAGGVRQVDITAVSMDIEHYRNQ